MKKYILKRGFFAVILSLLVISMYGVPAKHGLITIKQSDGSSIKVRIVGDERFHYYISEDGYLLTRSNSDYFYYSDFDSQTMSLRPTNVRANDVSKRDVSEQKFVATRSKELPASIVSMPKQLYRKAAAQKSDNHQKQGEFPTIGTQKSLAILVEFKDKKFTIANPKETFHRFMMEENFSDRNGAHCSVRDYFLESSEGLFDPQFDVYGPVTMPENMAYYGGNNASGTDQRPAEMVATACQMLDGEIDFSEYDRNNDGWVDNVYIFYAGYSEAEGASANTIWPHSWDVWLGSQIRVKLDGVYVGPYGCSNELNIDNDNLVGIGVFCHEFGHVLGLPDIYATDYNPLAFTPGKYTLMDAGEYNNNSNTPPLLTAYERWVLGWHTPEIIDRPANITLPSLSSSEKKSYMIKTSNENEMYFLENRQQEGFDEFIPGHGMLVWHIDYDSLDWDNNRVNNLSTHQGIDLVEADGRATVDSRAGDPFPGASGITSFTDNTYPSMRDWNNNPLNLPITEIKETDGVITFKVLGGIFELGEVSVGDPADITATSFLLKWSSVSRANEYLVSVYTLVDQKKVYVHRNISVGNINRYVVTGLSPLTEYYATVTASDGLNLSEESEAVQITTLEPDFSFYVPRVLPASEIKSNGFVANWELLKEATSYSLSVFKTLNSGMITENLDFSDGISGIPQKWTTNCNSVLVAEGFYGVSAPSMRMGVNGSYITSPLYNGTIKNISFWYKGQYFGTDNVVSVSVFNGREWRVLDFLNLTSGEDKFAVYGEEEEIPIGEDICQFRVFFEKVSDGFVYLDDIHVTVESKDQPQLVPGYDRLNVMNVGSYKVVGLDPETTYMYVVKASDGTKESLTSPQEFVTTLDGSNISQGQSVKFNVINDGRLITVTAPQNSKLEVYSLSGMLIKNIILQHEQTYITLDKGAYILKCDNKAIKTIIK